MFVACRYMLFDGWDLAGTLVSVGGWNAAGDVLSKGRLLRGFFATTQEPISIYLMIRIKFCSFLI